MCIALVLFLKHLAHIIGACMKDQGNSAEADLENLCFFAWTQDEAVSSDRLFFPSQCTVFRTLSELRWAVLWIFLLILLS